MKRHSLFQEWLMKEFGGNTPQIAISNKVDSILHSTKNEKFPVNLSSVANKIGINPTPIYEEQISRGSIVIHENQLRINLANKYRTPKMRFTYAHELIHCLFFDINYILPQRKAPKPEGLQEEWICNFGARRLIVPPNLLKKTFSTEKDASILSKIKDISNNAQASIPLVVLQLLENDLLPSESGRLYILSAYCEGYQNRNKKKPRCIIAKFYDQGGNKNNFLAANQGLQHIVTKKNNRNGWSLLSFHESVKDSFMEIHEELVMRDYDNNEFCISGVHIKISDTNYIWSELIIESKTDTNNQKEILKNPTLIKVGQEGIFKDSIYSFNLFNVPASPH